MTENHAPNTTPTTEPATEPTEEVAAAIADYESKLLSAAQSESGLAQMKQLVAACAPPYPADAITMLSTLAKFVGDVAGDDVDVSRLLSEWRVVQWLNRCSADGMNVGTRSNHQLRLRRMMRVQRGLPARIRANRSASEMPVRMPEDEQRLLEASFGDDDAGMVGAYVAAFGANLVAGEAVGAEVVNVDGKTAIRTTGGSRRIMSPLEGLAEQLVGRVIGDHDWKQLRARAECLDVIVNPTIARSTHAAMVTSEDASVLALVTQFGVSRRQLERAAELGESWDPDKFRSLLRD